jgi:uncharacterized protein
MEKRPEEPASLAVRRYAQRVITVSRLSVTPVKGLALHHPDEVTLTARGVEENRRFYLVDRAGFLFSGIDHGPLCRVRPTYDPATEHLSLELPDGRIVEGSALADGEHVDTDFYGRRVTGRVVEGSHAEALSDYVGKPLRLVRVDHPGDACDVRTLTFLSEASVDELRRRADRDEAVDERRFRMLVALAGCRAHEEDEWDGAEMLIGEAVVRVGGPVPRCATTTRDPETGERDFDALRSIKAYRGLRSGKHIDFGVYGEVQRPGRVHVGDTVTVEKEG